MRTPERQQDRRRHVCREGVQHKQGEHPDPEPAVEAVRLQATAAQVMPSQMAGNHNKSWLNAAAGQTACSNSAWQGCHPSGCCTRHGSHLPWKAAQLRAVQNSQLQERDVGRLQVVCRTILLDEGAGAECLRPRRRGRKFKLRSCLKSVRACFRHRRGNDRACDMQYQRAMPL